MELNAPKEVFQVVASAFMSAVKFWKSPTIPGWHGDALAAGGSLPRTASGQGLPCSQKKCS